jgi:hypothetical protein
MGYEILPYTRQKAKELGVEIRVSTKRNKKIDVFLPNKIISIGARGYMDYPHYLKHFGEEVANEKREAYRRRHKKDRDVKGTAGWYADNLLW